MSYRYMVVFKKHNGELLYRARTSYPTFKVGEKTSMGWTVEQILNMNNGKLLNSSEYDELLNRRYSAITKLLMRIDFITLLKYLVIGVVGYMVYCKL